MRQKEIRLVFSYLPDTSRAKNMGERSIGTKDPGAVSIAILFNGMAQAL